MKSINKGSIIDEKKGAIGSFVTRKNNYLSLSFLAADPETYDE
jgi:hypothetical protein